MPDEIETRIMGRRDLPDVVAIERASFDNPGFWYEHEFRAVMRQKNAMGRLATIGDRTAGFIFYELHDKYIRILNLAVGPEFRRRGVGRHLVEERIRGLSWDKRPHLATAVRETNLTAQLFFRAIGFRCVGIDPRWFDDSDEAAFMFRYRVPDPVTVRVAE